MADPYDFSDADPYAGLGSPVANDDPYAGLGTAVPDGAEDPYAHLGTPVDPATDPYAGLGTAEGEQVSTPSPEAKLVAPIVDTKGVFAPVLDTIGRSQESNTLNQLADPVASELMGVKSDRDYKFLEDAGLAAKQGGRELLHAVPETATDIASAAQYAAGDLAERPARVARNDKAFGFQRMRFEGAYGDELSPNERTAQALRGSAMEKSDKVNAQRQERMQERAEASPDYFGGRFKDNPSLARATVGAAPSVPGMALAVLNPVIGSALLTAQESAPNYVEMRENGFDPADAAAYTALHAAGTFALEKLPFDVPLPKSALSKTIGGPAAMGLAITMMAGTEAGTEVLQEGWQYATSKGFEGSFEDFVKDVDLLEVAASSALMGGGAGSARQALDFAGTADPAAPVMADSRVSSETDPVTGERTTTFDLAEQPELEVADAPVDPVDPVDPVEKPIVHRVWKAEQVQNFLNQNEEGRAEILQELKDQRSRSKNVLLHSQLSEQINRLQEAATDPVRQRSSIPLQVAEDGQFQAATPKGERQVQGAWQVVDAGSLVSSDQEGYDQSLQPRNRASIASATQVDEIARNLDPNRLMDSSTTDDGAPVISADGQVISGNGRVMALRSAYGLGTAVGYEQAVQAQAVALGLDTSGMQNPVLVRQLDPATENLQELAEMSNRPKILERNAAEVAQSDADLLSPELLARVDMEQPLTEKGNPEFFAGFVGSAKDASLLKADGSIDPVPARKRVGNAIVASLAAGHPQAREVITTLTEQAPALGLSKQLDAVAKSAPALIRTGALKPEYDLRGPFGKAMNEMVQFAKANNERKANNQKPISMQGWTGQLDIFSPRDNVADELSRLLMSANPDDIRTILDRYTTLAGQIDTTTPDMFGATNATPLDLLHRAASEVQTPVPTKQEVTKARTKARKSTSRTASANVAPDGAAFRTSETTPASSSVVRNSNSSANVGDITGAGWPGGEIAPAFKVDLPAVPDVESAGSVKPLHEYMGRPLQAPLDAVLVALRGESAGPVGLSTLPVSPNVRVDVDPFLLQGQVDTSTEGWQQAWEQGAAQFTSESDILSAVRSISMPASEFEQVKDQLHPLIKDWDGHVSESGNVVLTKPGHTRQILELPELVELAESLGQGNLPKIMGRFQNEGWLGVFRHGQVGKESIALRSDIFQLVTPAEIARLHTQADVYADMMQQADPSIDDKEKGFIARDRHEVLVEQAKAEARRSNPRLASKVLAHEIAHWVDHLPDAEINKRGNILGRLGVLTKFLKSELSVIPDHSPGLTKLDRNKLRSDARRRIREQGVDTKDPAFNKLVNAKFAELREIRRRESGLVSKDQIQGELRNFIAWWRGTDTMEEYFEQPKEMYAEAISGYILNPAELGRRAPMTFQLIENYINRKPAIKKMWDTLQDEIRSGQVQKNRVERSREMIREGDRASTAVGKIKETTSKEAQDAVIRTIDRKYGPIYRRAKKWSKAKGGELVEAIARYRYRSNQHERYVQDVNSLVLKNLVDHNLEWMDLEEYMLHYRVLNEREDLANPLGWNASTSQDRLNQWKRDIGEERFAKLEQSRAQMRKLYEDHVLAPLENSGALDAELMAYMQSNQAYATFVTHKGEQDALDNAMNGRYGTQVTSHVHKQVGTLQKIHGPATKTMEKGIQIIDMAMRNEGIEGMVQMLNEINTGEITKAEMKYDGRRLAPVIVNNDKIKTVMYLKNGEVQAYNVPKALADAWESTPSTEMKMLTNINKIFSQPLKALYTGWNYGLWPVLWMRDVQDFKRRMPRHGKLPLQGPVYWRLFFGAMKDAKSMATSTPTDTAKQAMDRGLTVSSVNFRGIWGEEQALNRLMKKYHQTPAAHAEDMKAGNKLGKAWNKYVESGQILERVSKIAGMKYMDKYFPDMPEYQRNQKVRMFAGSQDFLDTPTLLPAIDLFQMFYNPWKQGWRSEIESAKQHGAAVYAYTNFKYSVMPTILKWAVWSGSATGALALLTGGDEEEAKDIERQMKSVGEYDLMANHIIPMGWADKEEGTALYLRLPQSESQRLIGATVWKMLRALTEDEGSGQSAGESLKQALAYGGDQMPAGNPLYNVGKAVSDYYISGRNPVDGRTGYNIIPSTEFTAGGLEASEHLGKYAWNNLGGTMINRFELFEQDRKQTDMEKFLKMPLISNTIGRFLKVSNRGLYDAVKPFDEQEDKKRARSTLDIREAVKNDESYMPEDQYSAEAYVRELRKQSLDSMTSLEQDILEGVTGTEAKGKALDKLRAIRNE